MTILELREKRNKAWEAAKAFVETKRDNDGLLQMCIRDRKKTYVLIQMMEMLYSNRVYIFCSDDFKARQSIASLETPVHCISILGVFYKLRKMGKKKSEMQEYYDHLAAFLKKQTEYKVWSISGHQRDVDKRQVGSSQ